MHPACSVQAASSCKVHRVLPEVHMLLKWTIFSQVLDVTKEKRGKYLPLILLKLRDAACSYNNLSVTTEPCDSELFNPAALKNALYIYKCLHS